LRAWESETEKVELRFSLADTPGTAQWNADATAGGPLAETRKECMNEYLAALLGYLARDGEEELHSAYELGRRALVDGVGCLEMLAIHEECLAIALRVASSREESVRIAEHAGRFLVEILSSFEMSLRGYRETNARLSRNLRELQAAEAELRDQRDRLLRAEREQRRHRERLLAAHQALETEQLRYRELFDFAPDGYLVTGLDGTILEANRAAEVLIGVSGRNLIGRRLMEWMPEDARQVLAERIRILLEDGTDRATEWQLEIMPHSGTCFPVTLGVRAVHDSDGLPVNLRLLLRDVSERKRIEEQRARLLVREQVACAQGEAAKRFAFLAEVSALLVSSFDCETTLGGVADLTVPYLADSCLIYLTDRENGVRLLCSSHANQASAGRAGLVNRSLNVSGPQSKLASVLRTRRTEIFSSTSGGAPERGASTDPELLSFQMEENRASFLVVPMQSHSRVLGLIVLAAAKEGHFNQDYVALAEDLARRCALAVENAQLYRAMAAERDKAAEANRAKDEFLAVLGHELRNPLVPILGWARNLGKNRAAAEDSSVSQGAAAIERNARNILRLADDCLDLARISERKVALVRELLDLNQIVRDSIEALRLLARGKELTLETRLAPEELWVKGDRTRLDQVIYNLLMNAFKYTGAGGVISVSSVRMEDTAEIEIKDTGIGIAPEFLEQVFQPFRRGNRESHTSDASLGLGLAIARKIVELHGGTIWAESPCMGGGSAFHLRLELVRADDSAAGPHLPVVWKQEHPDFLRVLLIDDHKDTRELIRMELESLGYGVLTAPDGQAGLDTAIRCAPDVIVSDLRLPKIDGYELIRRVRCIPGLNSVPAIALTGLGMKKELESALAAGYDAHLNKPAEVNEIAALVQKLTLPRRAAGPGR
jgi:PAS domain S-box-containing protein